MRKWNEAGQRRHTAATDVELCRAGTHEMSSKTYSDSIKKIKENSVTRSQEGSFGYHEIKHSTKKQSKEQNKEYSAILVEKK